jgi:N-acetylglutamate synthase-like GNAT family acetyltransferase
VKYKIYFNFLFEKLRYLRYFLKILLIYLKKKAKIGFAIDVGISSKKRTLMDIQVVPSVGQTRWYSAIKEFYGLVAYNQELDSHDMVIIATIDDCIVGCCRLCLENKSRVLRGLQVHPHYRGQGISSSLLKKASEILGQEECYCLPYAHLESLYSKVGFVRIDENEAPYWFYNRYCDYKKQNRDVIIMKKKNSSRIETT